MIYNFATDPIEIKKIGLQIWSLRDQFEAIIQDHLAKTGTTDISSTDLKKLIQDFTSRPIDLGSASKEEMSKKSQEVKDILESELSPKPSAGPNPPASETPSAASPVSPTPPAEGPAPSPENAPPKVEVNPYSLISDDKISAGNTLLSDINMFRIAFFSQMEFVVGQSVLIEFMVPNSFVMNAEILYCKNYNMGSRIISATRPKYRLIAKFTFIRPGERTVLRSFVTSIQTENEKSHGDEKKGAGEAAL